MRKTGGWITCRSLQFVVKIVYNKRRLDERPAGWPEHVYSIFQVQNAELTSRTFSDRSTRIARPNFFQIFLVVLMVEDGENGSMGLVLNQPSDLTVKNVLQGHFDLQDLDDLVYTGGPVEPTAFFILHNAGDLDPGERPLLPGLFVGSTAEAFQDVIRRIAAGDSSVKFRVFRGCAGWAPNQLQGELERGDWLTIPASAEHILNEDPYDLWERLMTIAGRESKIIPSTEVNPEWN